MRKAILIFAVVAALLLLPAMGASAVSGTVFKGVTKDSEGNILGEGRVVKAGDKLLCKFEIINPFAPVPLDGEPINAQETWTVTAGRVGEVWIQVYPFGGAWEGTAIRHGDGLKMKAELVGHGSELEVKFSYPEGMLGIPENTRHFYFVVSGPEYVLPL